MITLGTIMFGLMAATTFEQTFDTGLEAYRAGKYEDSIQAFEQLVQQGVVEPSVFYNLGNAYYRSGRIGPAIANYERTLQLTPNLNDAQENLLRAVGGTERRLPKPPGPVWEQSLLFWHDSLSLRDAMIAAMAVWSLGWLFLSVRLIRRWPYLRAGAAAAFLLTAAFTASAWAKSHPQVLAVAAAERVPVHYGTNEYETVRFELYEGDRVVVDRRENGWARVTTADGERGWARDSQLAFVGPPYEPSAPLPELPSPEEPA